MTNPEHMYRWRQMTDEQRAAVLEQRREAHEPWHSPPHYESESTTYYMITAACFEHRHVIGHSPERMLAFEKELVEVLTSQSRTLFAWNLLPNHYHSLVDNGVDQGRASRTRASARTPFFCLEWPGKQAWAAGVVQRRRDCHEVRTTLLCVAQLRAAQRGTSWLCDAVDGVALLQCVGVHRVNRSREGRTTLEELSVV